MSEHNDVEEFVEESEIDSLKRKADVMGIKYSPNIGVETLRARIDEQIGVVEKEVKASAPAKPKPKKTKEQLKHEYYTRCRKDANKLIRIVVTCMNPNKKDWPGEIITVSNAAIGTVKKYVPFGIEEGYHVPHVIYEQLKNREYQHFVKTPRGPGGIQGMKSVISPEFNIRILDPLTKEQLKELADRQALNHSIE
jgi:hypothetical protein